MTLDAHLRLDLGDLALDAPLAVAGGEVVALLGPNGAGKTTSLRALAGLLALDAGHVTIDGTPVDDPATGTFVAPEHRPVGLVPQDHLLFPHLTLAANVAFGLRSRGAPRAEARATALAWLERVDLADLAGAKPRAVSGGQAQRAALARALATAPRLLLLDEPLAALDAGARAAVRRDLRQHLAGFGGASVMVTHDPLDALAIADRVVVLEGGRVAQAGTIAEVTTRPRSAYVADLIGVNLLRGEARATTVTLTGHPGTVVVAAPAQGPVLVLVPPRAVTLHRGRSEGSARNQWAGQVTGFDLLGDRVRVRLDGEVPLVAEVTAGAVAEMGIVEGDHLWATVKATEIECYPA